MEVEKQISAIVDSIRNRAHEQLRVILEQHAKVLVLQQHLAAEKQKNQTLVTDYERQTIQLEAFQSQVLQKPSKRIPTPRSETTGTRVETSVSVAPDCKEETIPLENTIETLRNTILKLEKDLRNRDLDITYLKEERSALKIEIE